MSQRKPKRKRGPEPEITGNAAFRTPLRKLFASATLAPESREELVTELGRVTHAKGLQERKIKERYRTVQELGKKGNQARAQEQHEAWRALALRCAKESGHWNPVEILERIVTELAPKMRHEKPYSERTIRDDITKNVKPRFEKWLKNNRPAK